MKVRVTKKNPGGVVPVAITTEYIKLQDLMKLCNAAPSGGMAKNFIQNGEVLVNGEVETRRGRKLYPGDTMTFLQNGYQVTEHEA